MKQLIILALFSSTILGMEQPQELTQSAVEPNVLEQSEKNNSVSMIAFHSDNINFKEFSPLGDKLVTASDDGTARIWDVATGQPLHGKHLRHDDAVLVARFDQTGKRIITGSRDKTAKIWNAETSTLMKDISVNEPVHAAEFISSNNKALIYAGNTLREITLLPVGSKKEILERKIGGELPFFSLQCGLKQRFCNAKNGTFVVVREKKKTKTTAKIFADLKDFFELQHESEIFSTIFSPKGNRLVTVLSDSTAKVWDVRTRELRHTLESHTKPIIRAEFSPSGDLLLTMSFDGTAKIWDVSTGKLLQNLDHPSDRAPWVIDGEFSPSGDMVVTQIGNEIYIWDTIFGTLLFKGLPPIKFTSIQTIDDVRFNPTGDSIVGIVGKFVLKWNVADLVAAYKEKNKAEAKQVLPKETIEIVFGHNRGILPVQAVSLSKELADKLAKTGTLTCFKPSRRLNPNTERYELRFEEEHPGTEAAGDKWVLKLRARTEPIDDSESKKIVTEETCQLVLEDDQRVLLPVGYLLLSRTLRSEVDLEARESMLEAFLRFHVPPASIRISVPGLSLSTWQLIEPQLKRLKMIGNDEKGNKAILAMQVIKADWSKLTNEQIIELDKALSYLDIPLLNKIIAKIVKKQLSVEAKASQPPAHMICTIFNEMISYGSDIFQEANVPRLAILANIDTEGVDALNFMGENGKKLRIQACIYLGTIGYTDDKHQNKTDWYAQALTLLDQDKDAHLSAETYLRLANAGYTDDKHQNKTDWYVQAVALVQAFALLDPSKNVDASAKIYLSLAEVGYTDEKHSNATDWCVEALKVLGTEGTIDCIMQIYEKLADMGYTDDLHSNGANWVKQQARGRNGRKSVPAQIFINLARKGYVSAEFKNSVQLYLHALNLVGPNENADILAQAYMGLGNAGYTDDQIKKPKLWYTRANDVLSRWKGDINLRVHAYLAVIKDKLPDRTFKTNDAQRQRGMVDRDGDSEKSKDRPDEKTISVEEQAGGPTSQKLLRFLENLGEHGDKTLRAGICLALAREAVKNKAVQVQNYLDALKILGEDGDINLRGRACMGLGLARHYDNKEIQKPSDWFMRALKTLGEDGDPLLVAEIYIRLGKAKHTSVHLHDENIPYIDWYNRALDLLLKFEQPSGKRNFLILWANVSLGDHYFGNGNLDEALKYYQAANAHAKFKKSVPRVYGFYKDCIYEARGKLNNVTNVMGQKRAPKAQQVKNATSNFEKRVPRPGTPKKY